MHCALRIGQPIFRSRTLQKLCKYSADISTRSSQKYGFWIQDIPEKAPTQDLIPYTLLPNGSPAYGGRPVLAGGSRKPKLAYSAEAHQVASYEADNLHYKQLGTRIQPLTLDFTLDASGRTHKFKTDIQLYDDLWIGCIWAFYTGYTPEAEAKARVICAGQSSNYPKVYQSLDLQADLLYVLGRIELEKAPKHRRFAWYMLSIAAELHHLDAALLLHRLERYDTKYTAGASARSVIATMAQRYELRATLASAEYTVVDNLTTNRQVRTIMTVIDRLERLMMTTSREETLRYLPHARPIQIPPSGFLDADELERYEPPARYLWKLYRDEHSRLKSNIVLFNRWTEVRSSISDDTDAAKGHKANSLVTNPDEIYVTALLLDAEEYNNVEAMYELTQLPPEISAPFMEPGSDTWIEYTRQAAISQNPHACFNYGKYLLETSGCYPTKAMMWRQGDTERKAAESLEICQEGFDWLRIAATVVQDGHPRKVAFLYLTMAGILSENGKHDDGLRILDEGITMLRQGEALNSQIKQQKSESIKLLSGLHDRWESYRIDNFDNEYMAGLSTKELYQGVRPVDAMRAAESLMRERT